MEVNIAHRPKLTMDLTDNGQVTKTWIIKPMRDEDLKALQKLDREYQDRVIKNEMDSDPISHLAARLKMMVENFSPDDLPPIIPVYRDAWEQVNLLALGLEDVRTQTEKKSQ